MLFSEHTKLCSTLCHYPDECLMQNQPLNCFFLDVSCFATRIESAFTRPTQVDPVLIAKGFLFSSRALPTATRTSSYSSVFLFCTFCLGSNGQRKISSKSSSEMAKTACDEPSDAVRSLVNLELPTLAVKMCWLRNVWVSSFPNICRPGHQCIC